MSATIEGLAHLLSEAVQGSYLDHFTSCDCRMIPAPHYCDCGFDEFKAKLECPEVQELLKQLDKGGPA